MPLRHEPASFLMEALSSSAGSSTCGGEPINAANCESGDDIQRRINELVQRVEKLEARRVKTRSRNSRRSSVGRDVEAYRLPRAKIGVSVATRSSDE